MPCHCRTLRVVLTSLLLVLAMAATACMTDRQPTAGLAGAGTTPTAGTPSPAAAQPTPTPAPAPSTPPQPSVDLERLRATAPPAPAYWPWGVSASVDRGHRLCADAEPPPTVTQATFARTDGSSSLTPDVVDTICAAAPKATLKIAIYYIENDGPDVQKILDALKFVGRRRAVEIRVVMDKHRRLQSGAFATTADQLREFATVRNCLSGCRSELPPRGEKGGSPQVEVHHHKFMVLSDTHFTGRVSPVVWTASANWSDPQLHTRSQSGLIVRDRGLAGMFSLRFDDLETCAKRGCAAWNRIAANRGLPLDRHGLVRRGGIWFDRTEALWQGSAGSGTFVQFSPWLRGDPVAAQLRGLRCTPDNDIVWVAQRVIGRSRHAVTSALTALDDAGCDVRVLISGSSLKHLAVFYDGYLHVRERGLDVSCVKGIHDKFLLIKAVDRATGKRVRSLTAGSQGMLKRALNYSDEALITLTSAGASRRAKRANKAVWRSYKQHFEILAAQKQPCP